MQVCSGKECISCGQELLVVERSIREGKQSESLIVKPFSLDRASCRDVTFFPTQAGSSKLGESGARLGCLLGSREPCTLLFQVIRRDVVVV